MPFALPPLPNFNVQTPQMPDPVANYGRMLQLKQLMGEQQLLPLQRQEEEQRVQAETLANQKQQMELDSQKKLIGAISSGAFNKYAGVETADGTGFDAANAYQDLVKNHGVLPEQAQAAVNSLLTIAKNNAEIFKTTQQGNEAAQNVRGKTLESLANKLASIGDMKADDASKALASLKQDLVRNPKAFQGMTQQELAELYSASLEHLPAIESLLGLEAKIADFHKAKAEATAAEQKIINPASGMSAEQQAEAAKQVAVETNPQVQQNKLELTKAEAQVREQVEASMLPLLEQIRQQFGNQKDARDKIESTVLKPYQDKMTDIQMARSAISQAQTNPVAARAAIFKMVGVAQPTGAHRVLPMEFSAFKYPGGISDQVVEHFNDFLKGEPWTPEIAQAANAFIDGQEGAQQAQLNAGIDKVNQLYGTQVGTGLKKSQVQQSAGHKVGDQITQNGHTFTVDKVDQNGKVIAAH